MLVPAHNEESTVVDTVRAILALSYPDLEVVIVNDGSVDDTIGVLQRTFALQEIHPIFQSRIETKSIRSVMVSIDADTLIEPDALLRLVNPFITDPSVAAVVEQYGW
ncbi:MAG: glycosyltransferase involved in cell wall biosynthesis [Candidatus Poriferisodalaceae bacterium]